MNLASLAIEPLALHREHLPVIASWFRQEWPAWYGPGGRGNAEADLRAFSHSELELPLGLVVLHDCIPIAVGALKQESLPSHRHLKPWAGAGLVLPAFRRRGIGGMLLTALASQSVRLGYSSVYCATATAVGLLRRGGWSELERTEHEGESLVIFQKAAV